LRTACTVLRSIKKTLAYRRNQSYFFIAASNASGSKSNEISKLESGSAPESFLLESCRRCRCESCECDEVGRICGFVAAGTVVACDVAAATAVGRTRGGRNGFFVAAEWGLLLLLLLEDDDENERGTVRVIPSARLVCDGGGCADNDKVEVAAAAVAVADVDEDDVDLPCLTSESVIGTAEAAAAAPFRTLFTAGGNGVGVGCDCCK
jgi:hypothetical protein